MAFELALSLALIQLALFALCWGLIALLMPQERRPALLFLALCASDALTAWLHVGQEGVLGPVAPWIMTLGLASATLVCCGADAFVHRRLRQARFWFGVCAVGVAAMWLPLPAGADQVVRLAVYQGAFLLLLVGPLIWLRAGILAEFGRYGWLPLLPFALMSLPVAAFLVQITLQPEVVPARFEVDPVRGARSLIPFAIVSGIFHITWLGMMLGRQVVAARQAARIDTLTGTLRRGAFEAELEHGIAAAARLGHPLTLAFVDVDHFKRINDLGGHAAGDQVLRRLGAVIGATLRNTDRCGRWGGEEFVLLLPGLAPAQAPRLLQRLRRRLEAERIAVPAGCAALTLSIGYAGCEAGERPELRQLIRRADDAMYAAKRRGRDTLVGWHELGGDSPASADASA